MVRQARGPVSKCIGKLTIWARLPQAYASAAAGCCPAAAGRGERHRELKSSCDQRRPVPFDVILQQAVCLGQRHAADAPGAAGCAPRAAGAGRAPAGPMTAFAETACGRVAGSTAMHCSLPAFANSALNTPSPPLRRPQLLSLQFHLWTRPPAAHSWLHVVPRARLRRALSRSRRSCLCAVVAQ